MIHDLIHALLIAFYHILDINFTVQLTCLYRYTGVPGDANTVCNPIKTSRRRLSVPDDTYVNLASSPSPIRTPQGNPSSAPTEHQRRLSVPQVRDWQYIDGALCNANINCYSGKCYRGICQVGHKRCPNECSGTINNPQGRCKFYDEYDNSLDTCAAEDFKCRAVCDCFPGFYGMDCSIDRRSDFESFQSLKETLCLNLYETLEMQDLDEALVAERAEIVVDTLLDPTLITPMGFEACAKFLVETVDLALDQVSQCTYLVNLLNLMHVLCTLNITSNWLL